LKTKNRGRWDRRRGWGVVVRCGRCGGILGRLWDMLFLSHVSRSLSMSLSLSVCVCVCVATTGCRVRDHAHPNLMDEPRRLSLGTIRFSTFLLRRSSYPSGRGVGQETSPGTCFSSSIFLSFLGEGGSSEMHLRRVSLLFLSLRDPSDGAGCGGGLENTLHKHRWMTVGRSSRRSAIRLSRPTDWVRETCTHACRWGVSYTLFLRIKLTRGKTDA
jgi:hypothetical protein